MTEARKIIKVLGEMVIGAADVVEPWCDVDGEPLTQRRLR